MADEKKPTGILRIPTITPSRSRVETSRPIAPILPMKTEDELRPLVLRIVENADLMQRFRAVIGCDDQERGRQMIDEIRKFAQTLDPTVTFSDGTSIAVILMGIVGHPKARQND
jgi:hypothetical protein